MFYFYPKEIVANCPKGFNMPPVVQDENDPTKLISKVEESPFANYKDEVIQISKKDYIKRDLAVEVKSYVLAQHERSWLLVKDKETNTTRLGLLRYPTNRGEESKALSFFFNSLVLAKDEPRQKELYIMGYIIEEDSVTFILRTQFNSLPRFASSQEIFVPISPEDIMAEHFIDDYNPDKYSQYFISLMKPLFNAARSGSLS